MTASHTSKPSVRVHRLDLERWRGTNENRVLAGRDFGQAARKQAGLQALETQDLIIEVNVPRDFIAVTSSFFRGMFGDSVRILGEEAFRAKFRFVGKDITRVKEDGIRDALRHAFPLAPPTA